MKIIIILLVLLLLQSCSPLTGDINLDGKVDDTDIEMVRNHVLRIELLTESEIKRADLNGDGKINSIDITLLRQIILKEKSK